MAKTTIIDVADKYLDLRLMAPFSCQSRMAGPKVLCDNNQLCALCDDLPKKNAASNRNGTVGSTGRKMPANPARTHSTPNISQTIRTIRPVIDEAQHSTVADPSMWFLSYCLHVKQTRRIPFLQRSRRPGTHPSKRHSGSAHYLRLT